VLDEGVTGPKNCCPANFESGIPSSRTGERRKSRLAEGLVEKIDETHTEGGGSEKETVGELNHKRRHIGA